MCVLSEMSRRLQSGAIAACGVLWLIVVASASGHSRALALAINEPADSGAIETGINPPFPQPNPAVEPPGAAARVPAGNPLWAIPLRLLNVTRERPLFSPSRRPPPAAIVAAPSAAPAQPAVKHATPDHPLLTLLGTVIGGHEGIGIFVDQASKNVISLRSGQEHDGWTLREVRDRETVFERHHRQAILALPARSATNGPVVPGVNSAALLPAGTWMDGDGQMISPPSNGGDRKSIGSADATWRDGDGRLITPPPMQVGVTAQH